MSTSAAPASRVLVPTSNSNSNISSLGSSDALAKTAAAHLSPNLTASPSSRLLRAAQSKEGTNSGHGSPAGSPSKDASGGDLKDPKGSWRSWQRGDGLAGWERDMAASAEVRRKANVAQLFFLNHYFDSLRYLSERRARQKAFEGATSISIRDTLSSKQGGQPDELRSYLGRERALLRKRRTKLRLANFHIITQVGQGGYGEVFLARKHDTGEVCALKKLKKRVLVKMDEVRHVLTERDILTATRTPWLVRLLFAFQDAEHVYLAMEYVPGGDFRTLLNSSGVLMEEHARFYMAEMLVACNELHKLGYIHRDLKPENFLVDATGHIKLTDFGLAAGALNPGRIESLKGKLDAVKDTELVYRTPKERASLYKQMRAQNVQYADSVVGSPDYMAPEVLRGKEYGVSVDYWSLGCILFEFLSGYPPFSGEKPEETWNNLKHWDKCLRRPYYTEPQDLQFNLSDVAWSAVTKLIDHPHKRLSSISAVAAHPFFAPLDMANLRKIQAPFIPELASDADTGYFDDFTNEEDMKKYKEVQDKARNVAGVQESGKGAGGRGLWAGFTFGKNGYNANGRPAFDTSSKDASDVFSTMF